MSSRVPDLEAELPVFRTGCSCVLPGKAVLAPLNGPARYPSNALSQCRFRSVTVLNRNERQGTSQLNRYKSNPFCGRVMKRAPLLAYWLSTSPMTFLAASKPYTCTGGDPLTWTIGNDRSMPVMKTRSAEISARTTLAHAVRCGDGNRDATSR